MSLFGAMPIANSGIDAAQEWIDATGGNIANADDTGPTSQGAYQTQYVDAVPLPSGQAGRGGPGRDDRDRARQQRGHRGVRPGESRGGLARAWSASPRWTWASRW